MGRPLRIEYPGAFYHVMLHGNGKLWPFKDEQDHNRLFDVLGKVVEKYHLKIHAFIPMMTHLHLVIETVKANLSRAISRIARDYAMYYNQRRRRKGSVFRSRYKAILVQKERYYLSLLRYLYFNPVKARLTSNPYDYCWGSLYFLINERARLEKVLWFNPSFTLSFFGENRTDAIKKLKKYIGAEAEDVNNPEDNMKYRYFLGEESWVESKRREYGKKRGDYIVGHGKRKTNNPEEILKAISHKWGITEEELVNKKSVDAAKTAIYLLYKKCDLTQKTIGKWFGMKPAAVAQCIKRYREKGP